MTTIATAGKHRKRTVTILDTGHLQQSLGSWCGDDTGTTGSGDQTRHD